MAAAFASVTLVGYPCSALASNRADSVDASVLKDALEAGKPVVRDGVDVQGTLRLPKALDVPLILRNSRIRGDIVGAYGAFSRVIDLSGSTIEGRIDFAGARFDGPFLFEGTDSGVIGACIFTLAVFTESARFGDAGFRGRVEFAGTQFHGESRFAGSSFAKDADFSLAGFDGVASFAGAHFERASRFADARFGGRADFIGASFDGNGPSADFSHSSFEAGATFLLSDVKTDATFALASASGDIDFQGAKFRGEGLTGSGRENLVADFSTARFFEAISFVDAELDGFVNFDQAVLADIDLRRAAILSEVWLPLGRESGGSVASLQLDLDDTARISGPDDHGRPAREVALELVETTARARDDLETANSARLRRLTLVRRRKPAPAEALDFAVNYGIWGYGVRPLHQLAAIAVLVVVGTAAREARRRKRLSEWKTQLSGVVEALGDSLRALLRLQPPAGAWSIVEYLAFKLLTVMLVLNAANVWPVSRELIEGIL